MATEEELELEAAVDRVLASRSPKKLVVAGPGAGKTTLFGKLLDQSGGKPDDRLVLTFINNLKSDLERSLGDRSRVNTLHGYCLALLYRVTALRGGPYGRLHLPSATGWSDKAGLGLAPRRGRTEVR
jgi:superfamily I DNA/RNA helicase